MSYFLNKLFFCNSENIMFYPCTVKYEIINYRTYDIFLNIFYTGLMDPGVRNETYPKY